MPELDFTDLYFAQLQAVKTDKKTVETVKAVYNKL